MRAVFFWEAAGLSLDRANPYGALLARAVRELGVELVAGYPLEFTAAWLRAHRAEVDVLHFNWLHHFYHTPDLATQVARCSDFVSNLALARELGYKLVWTVHNLYPHETTCHALDHLVRLAMAQMATAVIVHCRHARALVQQHFHRSENVFVIPHGNFIAAYPNAVTRAEARQQLSIPADRFVFLFFGNVRQYKGVDDLLATFSALPGAHLLLLLAAKLYNPYSEQLIEQAKRADPRVIIRTSRFFPNEEFQYFFNAADVAVFPFVDVLTSGSTITALSFGLPVIVPAIGCLPELVDETMGIIYDPVQPNGLQEAMLAIQARDLGAARAAAFRRARSLTWDTIARHTLAAYQC